MTLDAQYRLVTPRAPGAVAIIQITGPDAATCIEQLTGRRPTRRAKLVSFADIDQGLIVSLSDDWCQLMPHGGMRVIQRIGEALRKMGVTPAAQPDSAAVPLCLCGSSHAFPEAQSELEADMLAALALAPSPAAIDLLLAQPDRWRSVANDGLGDMSALLERSRPLDHLMNPPRIVVVGPPNVGKSTLSNALIGRSAGITADQPGTTRDWMSHRAELPSPLGPIAVQWFDTPGLRESDDPIERQAIDLARRMLDDATVLIAMRDPTTDWPATERLPRGPDLRVLNKADLLADAARPTGEIAIAATTGWGFDLMFSGIVKALGLGDIDPAPLWAFNARLKQIASEHDVDRLKRYVGTTGAK